MFVDIICFDPDIIQKNITQFQVSDRIVVNKGRFVQQADLINIVVRSRTRCTHTGKVSIVIECKLR